MFELDREVDQWCQDILNANCARQANLDELKDHLHCLIEEQVKQGQSEQEAFVSAIKHMGDSQLIKTEYSKNQTLLQKISAHDRRLQEKITNRFSAKQLSVFMIVYSLICAGLMLMASSFYPEHYRMLNNVILVVWFIPFVVVASVPSVRKAECAMFKNLINRRKAS